MNRLTLAVTMALVLACNEPRPEGPSSRRRAAKTVDRTDTSLPMDVKVAFEPPSSWERVKLPTGLEFSQPPGFTIVNGPAIVCDARTLPGDSSVLRTELAERWPLTLAMRRGDLAQIARANGFTLDSTDIAAHGQQPGDTTIVRRGEGWLLLYGRTAARPLLATVRAPDGCSLVWAARGSEINVDTLGLVMATVRYGAPDSASRNP
ncbi:MAG TPA: hypothetical protein VEB19_15540 [Gemmatimonadaceae bacterium]|nr:hypothetical protein [Gemmatimonadaceae bacterium]